jgi:hypothetical protein
MGKSEEEDEDEDEKRTKKEALFKAAKEANLQEYANYYLK